MKPRRHVVAAIFVAIGALIYGISPIDIIPELLTGPFGLADDLALWAGAGLWIYNLLNPKPKGAEADKPGSTPPN